MFRLAIMLCLLFGAGQAQVDKTLIPMEVGSGVVDAVVDMISEVCIFSDDARFLRRIAFVATTDGEDAHTFKRNGANYHGGIWQVDEAVFEATKQATQFFDEIEANFNIKWADVQWIDLLKPLYCGLASRIAIEEQTNGIVPRSIAEQAVIWAEHLQTISSDHQAMENQYNNVAGALPSDCEVPRADLMFVMDSSGSIGSTNFELTKEFVVSVVEHFTISNIGVRVAVITYSTNTVIEFDLERYDDKDELIQAIRDITYLGGNTNSADALLTMKDVFSDQGRGQYGVPEIGIFMTDGRSNDADATALAAAEVHATKITVFSMGITTSVNEAEVELIGSSPACVHVYYLTTFDDVTHFAEQIERLACKAPADLTPGDEVVGDIPTGSEYYFKTNVSKTEGATVMVEMAEGAVEVFLSYEVRNPSEILHSHSFKVTSADGLRGLYIPHPSQKANPWFIASLMEKTKRAVDDSVELFGTLVGTNYGMQNSYKLTVAEGYEWVPAPVDGNSASNIVGNTVAMVMALVGAIMLKM